MLKGVKCPGCYGWMRQEPDDVIGKGWAYVLCRECSIGGPVREEELEDIPEESSSDNN